MALLPLSLRNIDSRRVGGCQKLECVASGILHRHHTRHEAMWFGIWSGRRRGEKKWDTFRERYHKFLPQDCVILCPNHHAEIHAIYDQIIQEDKNETGRNLASYSWRQAEVLMSKLSEECYLWLKTETPGISTTLYAKQKAKQ